MVTSGAELDVLRERLTADQRAVLNAIWDHYLAHNQWVPRRLVHQKSGKPAALAILEELGANIICESRDDGKDYYRLTFLGVLLTGQGEESEDLLVRYLEYVREHVLTHFPPGGPSWNTEKSRGEFWFISDPDLQRQLATDWRETQDVYQVRGWKSCVVLCGGILEALLLDALPRDAFPRGQQASSAEASRRDLADLLKAARDRGVLGTGLPPLGQALREFRHLIHPGVPTCEKVEVTRDEAEAAMIAVRMYLRQIAASRGG
jgi:hypothetical protein